MVYSHDSRDNFSGMTGGYVNSLKADSLGFDVSEATDMLLHRFTFKTVTDTSDIYYYDEGKGLFLPNGEQVIQKTAVDMYPDISTQKMRDLTNHISWKTYTHRNEFDRQIEWLACRSCMVNLLTFEVAKFSPKFMATVSIPVEYKPSPIIDFFRWIGDDMIGPSCPRIMKFLNEVMATQDVEIVLDFMSYCLYREVPFHVYLILAGSGRNGKGVLMRLISRLLGQDNVSAESLHRLLENSFAVAELYGKMANIDADMSKEILRNTGLLKKLTGGDYIVAEKKYKNPFKYLNQAKLVLSANQLSNSEDDSDAFFARPIIVNLPNQFIGEKDNPRLIEELSTPEEISGLFEILLKRLPRVLRYGFQPSVPIEKNYDKYMMSSDPVKAFYESCVEVDAEGKIVNEDMYESFLLFCRTNRLPTESSESFSRRFRITSGYSSRQLRHSNGSRRYFWLGLKFKDWQPPNDGQSTL